MFGLPNTQCKADVFCRQIMLACKRSDLCEYVAVCALNRYHFFALQSLNHLA